MRANLYHNLLFFLIGICFTTPCYAQFAIQIKENVTSSCLTNHKPKQGNALLIFKTNLDVSFESSWGIEEIINEKNSYILEIEAVPHAIYIYYENTPTVLNLGMKNATVNLFSKLTPGEIKCFTLEVKPELLPIDITDNELKRGNFPTVIGPNVSDALFLIRIFPTDLELTISETSNLISKVEKKGSSYNVFLKMSDSKSFANYNLIIKSDNTDEIKIALPKLAPKAAKIYSIKVPISPELEPDNGVGSIPDVSPFDYRKNVLGSWAGSLGDDKTYLEFTTLDEGKKTLTGKIYADGIYMNFKGAIRYKTDDDYQASLSIVESDLITSGASIDLRFNSGVLHGLWIDDIGGVRDFSAVRSTSIIYDNSNEVRQRIASLNNAASGTWNAVNSNFYFDNIVIDNANIQQTTSLSFVKSNQPVVYVKGKLLIKSGQVSLVVSNVKFPGILTFCTVTLFFNEQSASLSIISDDGSIIENYKLVRPIIKSTLTALGNDKVYYVKADKTYFHNTPEVGSRSNKYIVKGQLPAVQVSSSSDDFFLGAFTYRGTTTKGFLLKSDLAEFNLNYLVGTKWSGLFGNNQIIIAIENMYWNDNNIFIVKGYNLLKGKKREIEGTFVLINGNQIQLNLAEPGTDEWDGIFKITFNYNNEGSGVWLSNNGKLRREFNIVRDK